MPELPEVETVARGLNKLIVGKTISSVFCDNQKSLPIDRTDINNFIISAKVINVSRRAKIIVINMSSGYSLLGHLKMTGQMVYRGEDNWGGGHPTDSFINELPDKSTRVIFEFTDGTKLFFNDQRKFGWIRLYKTDEINTLSNLAKLGPEPLSSDFSEQILKANLLKRKNSNIKAVLLDQTIISGIGNIYADEVLFMTKIHPETKVSGLRKNDFKVLHQEIIKVLQKSIDQGGSTNRNYVNAEGKKGNYLTFANVYGRAGLPCLICDSPISKIKVAGRGTHICIHCQKVKV